MISVIRVRNNEGSTNAVRAWADVRVTTDAGSIRINGLSLVESSQGGYFISMPQRKSNDKWFSIVEIEGRLREEIHHAVMEAWKNGQ